MQRKARSFARALLAIVVSYAGSFPSIARSQSPYYYEGKTITIVRGGSPGGTGDQQARALIPYLKKYIPGEPHIVISNMPGAGGMKAVNHIYATAKRDGLSIGAVGGGLVAGPILDLPGANYDLNKLIYLGSTDSGEPYIFLTRKEAGLNSLEKLRAASNLRIGAQTVGHPVYIIGRLFAYLLGVRNPQMVVGYGGPELDIALIRGEVDARANNAEAIVSRHRKALEAGEFHIHATITLPKGRFHPGFQVPDLDGFAKNEKERQLLTLYRTFMSARWPYILPPGTPDEIVIVLQNAMAKALNDPGFRKDFRKVMGVEPTPLAEEELKAAILGIPRDREITALYKMLAEQGPLPPR
jgi:tripartite-type tricarboxylate transporter receptor subunit TctC